MEGANEQYDSTPDQEQQPARQDSGPGHGDDKGDGNGGNGQGASDRDKVLEKLRAALEACQKEADRKEKECKKRKTSLDDLTKSSGEIDKIVDDYRDKYEDLKCELENLKCSFDPKWKEICETLDEKERKRIDDIVKACDEAIEELRESIDQLEKKGAVKLTDPCSGSVQEAEFDVRNCQLALDNTQAEFDKVKGVQARIDEKLEQLGTLLKAIEDACSKKDYAVAYFKALDFKKCCGEAAALLKKWTVAELRKELDRLWGDLKKAKETLVGKEGVLNDRSFELEARKKNYDEAIKGREEKILDQIERQ